MTGWPAYETFFNAERDALLKHWREVEDLSIAECRERFGDNVVSYECVRCRAKVKGYNRPGYSCPKNGQVFWAEDENRVEVLKKMFGEGATFREIGKSIGASPSMVSGKCHRLGLKRGKISKPVEQTARLGPKHELRGSSAEKLVTAYPRSNVLETSRRISPQIWELNEGEHCRWPMGDPLEDGFHFCGERKCRGAYCEIHADIAYKRRSSLSSWDAKFSKGFEK